MMLKQFLVFVRGYVHTKATVRPTLTKIHRVMLSGRSAVKILQVMYTDAHVALDRKAKLAAIAATYDA